MACPGDFGIIEDLFSGRGMAGGIEAEEDLSIAVPVRFDGVEVPFQTLGIEGCSGTCQKLCRARRIDEGFRQDVFQIHVI